MYVGFAEGLAIADRPSPQELEDSRLWLGEVCQSDLHASIDSHELAVTLRGVSDAVSTIVLGHGEVDVREIGQSTFALNELRRRASSKLGAAVLLAIPDTAKGAVMMGLNRDRNGEYTVVKVRIPPNATLDEITKGSCDYGQMAEFFARDGRGQSVLWAHPFSRDPRLKSNPSMYLRTVKDLGRELLLQTA